MKWWRRILLGDLFWGLVDVSGLQTVPKRFGSWLGGRPCGGANFHHEWQW